jgi:PTH1 family peptidyl-tRNA hydrolase
MVVDKLINTLTVSPHVEKKLDALIFYHHKSQIVFARPQTFINSSGSAVKKLLVHFKAKPADLWVIHDDLDLVLGNYKIQKGKGPREHNGLLSIYEKLETKNFWHVRVGIDNRDISPTTNHQAPTSFRPRGEEYVLQDFSETEIVQRDKTIDEVVNNLIQRLSKQA